jgi:rhizosphere induced protein
VVTDDVFYSIYFDNQSNNTGSVCVYQKEPDIKDPKVMSLAWFSKPAHPTTKVQFKWQIKYNFVWDQTGELKPGIIFDATQIWDADLMTRNTVTLTHDSDGYNFKELTSGGQQGTLYIKEDDTILDDDVSVGIGMSGFGTFVKQGQPNWNLNFTPHPEYWVTFGDYEQGQVLDIGSISNTAQIAFPRNVYKMQVTLQENNKWKIEPIKALQHVKGRELVFGVR